MFASIIDLCDNIYSFIAEILEKTNTVSRKK